MLRDLGPTFNHARRVRVSYLSIGAVEALIRNPYVAWLDFPDPVVRALYRLTHGNPFFTQIICHELVDRACEARAIQVSSRDVELVSRDLVALQLSVEQMAHLYEVGGRRDALELVVLHLASKDADLSSTPAVALETLCSSIRASEGEVKQAVGRLVEREVLRNVPEKPGFVEVVMPLFAAWFRQACPLTDEAWARVAVGAP